MKSILKTELLQLRLLIEAIEKQADLMAHFATIEDVEALQALRARMESIVCETVGVSTAQVTTFLAEGIALDRLARRTV